MRLEDVRSTLARPNLELDQALGARNRAEVLRSYARTARLSKEVADEAAELRLRAERKVGELLIQLVESKPLAPTRSRPRANRAGLPYPPRRRLNVPRDLLASLGIRHPDSSNWQLVARIPEPEFEQRLAATRAAGRTPAMSSLIRAAHQFSRATGGRKKSGTASLLDRALDLLRQVRELRTPAEVRMAKQVVAIAETWSHKLEQRSARVDDGRVERVVSCLLCGRRRPDSQPARCQVCGGAWMSA